MVKPFLLIRNTQLASAVLIKCMQVKYTKNDKDYTLFYDQIESFTFENANEYELLILEQKGRILLRMHQTSNTN